MSTLTLKERFQLDAPVELVWDHLVDPERTVSCLPGAQLTGKEDDRTYAGTIKVKVGSVTMSYRGKVVFEELDEENRYVRVVGRGRERTGSGSATMTMESRVVALEDGGSEVTVDSEVRLTGRIVRFGRGMIGTISAEIFKEFRVRLAETLQEELETSRPRADTEPTPEPKGDEELLTPEDVHREAEALSLVPLLLRALRSWLARLFGRGDPGAGA